ncbi:hypothetical protein [Aquimarina sp. AD10]|uniref:hypothetical protein n=1 Tax=Aquimarina sp. AD10 TaxID=1714849 RepID=UPI001F082BEF|nr:hypothetical protein [Aquimarina sp. AD10]
MKNAGTGNYTVTLSTPRTTADYTVHVTVFNSTILQTTAQVTNQTTSSFTIQLYASNVFLYTIDRDWYFTVEDF